MILAYRYDNQVLGERLLFREHMFPDGQPHVKIEPHAGHVLLLARLTSGNDVLALLLTEEAVRSAGATRVTLVVGYLLGARMDRRIAPGEPHTLKIICGLLRGRFEQIILMDPHSNVARDLLTGPVGPVEVVLPVNCVRKVIHELGWTPSPDVALCAPDAGAGGRVRRYAKALGDHRVVHCTKHRDPETGVLSGFRLSEADEAAGVPKRVLITDDLCDGGGTFAAVARLLKSHGAKWVGLYVTHGIFSKGFEIENIDRIFCAATYRDERDYPPSITVVGNMFTTLEDQGE